MQRWRREEGGIKDTCSLLQSIILMFEQRHQPQPGVGRSSRTLQCHSGGGDGQGSTYIMVQSLSLQAELRGGGVNQF